MSSLYRLSVVFCAVDETYSLQQAYAALAKDDLVFEFFFILSKNCSAACLETVKRLCCREKCSFFFQSGCGLGNAIRDAFALVRGTHILIWPADDGISTDIFPEMVSLSKRYPDKIISVSRWLKKNSFYGYGTIRKGINYLSQKLFAVLYRSNLTDYTNPTQIAPVSVYRSIKWTGSDFSFIPEMTFKPLRLGYSFLEVPAEDHARSEGKKHGSFFEYVRYYSVILHIRFQKKRDLAVSEKV